MSTMKTIGVGRLVADPVLRQVGSNQVVEFTLACTERYGTGENKKEKTSFLDFNAWDKAAGVIAQYAKKGDQLFVVAIPRKDAYEDKDGNKRYKSYFRTEEFNFISSGKRHTENSPVESEPEDVAPQPETDEVPF
jgi:single-strand DNA-binding protein